MGAGLDGEDVVRVGKVDQTAIRIGVPIEKSDPGGWTHCFVLLAEKDDGRLLHPGEFFSSSVDEAMELSQGGGGYIWIAEEIVVLQVLPIPRGFGYRANDGGEKGSEKEKTGVQIKGRTEEAESAKPLGFPGGEEGAEETSRRQTGDKDDVAGPVQSIESGFNFSVPIFPAGSGEISGGGPVSRQADTRYGQAALV